MESNNNNATVVASENNNAATNAASENNKKSSSSFWSKAKTCLLWAGGALGIAGVGYGAYKYGFDAGYNSCIDNNSETFELARRQREYEMRKQQNNNI